MSRTESFVDEFYRLFEDAYSFFNERLFEGSLVPCMITFQRQARLMGYVAFKRWVNVEGKTMDELAINPAYFANYPLSEILQTLCHEMVHIWQEYYGSPSRPSYHNREWADKMKKIGLMPSSTGKPGGAIVGETMSQYVIEGGLFDKAANELLESGFTLRWVDTIQMPPPLDNQQPRHPSNVVSLPSRREPQNENDDDPIYSNFPLNLTDIAEKIEQQQTNELRRPALMKSKTTKAKNKSNRHKYYCPRCSLQVWGKPDLSIKCGNCNDEPLLEDL